MFLEALATSQPESQGDLHNDVLETEEHEQHSGEMQSEHLGRQLARARAKPHGRAHEEVAPDTTEDTRSPPLRRLGDRHALRECHQGGGVESRVVR